MNKTPYYGIKAELSCITRLQANNNKTFILGYDKVSAFSIPQEHQHSSQLEKEIDLLSNGILFFVDAHPLGNQYLVTKSKFTEGISIPDILYLTLSPSSEVKVPQVSFEQVGASYGIASSFPNTPESQTPHAHGAIQTGRNQDSTQAILKVLPLDIKTSVSLGQHDFLGQISALNLAKLITLSPKIKHALDAFQNHFSAPIVLYPGYFLSDATTPHPVSEAYTDLRHELLSLDKKFPGIFSDEKAFTFSNGELTFSKTQDIAVHKPTFEEFKTQLDSIKAFIGKHGFFPSVVEAFGYDKEGRKILQFSYHPFEGVSTFSPRYFQLEQRIVQLEEELARLDTKVHALEHLPNPVLLEQRLAKEYTLAMEGLEKRELRILAKLTSAANRYFLLQQKYASSVKPISESKSSRHRKLLRSVEEQYYELQEKLDEVRTQKKSIHDQFNAYKTSLKWYSPQGILLTEQDRKRQLEKLTALYNQKLEALEHSYNDQLELLTSIMKTSLADSKDEFSYEQQKKQMRAAYDTELNKKIQEYHSQLPYALASVSPLNVHPFVLYLNNTNRFVYRIAFANVLR
ncbi:MAG: hypothetical protein QW594_01200 [Candidatus Woesearchaeota archaeon]